MENSLISSPTLLANDHLKKGWFLLSIFNLHSPLTKPTPNPHFAKLSLGVSLSVIANQQMKACLGIDFENQINFHHLTIGALCVI